MSSNKKFNELYSLLRNEFHEILPELNDIFFFFFQGNTRTDILECSWEIFFILDKDLEIELIFILLLCKAHCLIIMGEILTYLYSCFYIEKIALKTALWKKIT